MIHRTKWGEVLFRVAISLFNCSCGSSGQGRGLGSDTKHSVRLVVVVVAPVLDWVYWLLSGVWRRGGPGWICGERHATRTAGFLLNLASQKERTGLKPLIRQRILLMAVSSNWSLLWCWHHDTSSWQIVTCANSATSTWLSIGLWSTIFASAALTPLLGC